MGKQDATGECSADPLSRCVYRAFNQCKGFTGSFRLLCCVDTKDANKIGLLWGISVCIGTSRDSWVILVDLGVLCDLSGSQCLVCLCLLY